MKKLFIFLFTMMLLIIGCSDDSTPVGGGYDAIGTFSEGDAIFKSTLMRELVNLFMIVYNFIDYNIINLPRIVV